MVTYPAGLKSSSIFLQNSVPISDENVLSLQLTILKENILAFCHFQLSPNNREPRLK